MDPGLVDEAIADPTTSDEVLSDHRRVVEAAGFGVPTLFFPDGQCLFGPVLIDPPTGADELLIAHTFRPYLEARDWVSINRGEVITFDPPTG